VIRHCYAKVTSIPSTESFLRQRIIFLEDQINWGVAILSIITNTFFFIKTQAPLSILSCSFISSARFRAGNDIREMGHSKANNTEMKL
jgi:hypothetical protein